MSGFLFMRRAKIFGIGTFYLAFDLVRVDLSIIFTADFLLVFMLMTS